MKSDAILPKNEKKKVSLVRWCCLIKKFSGFLIASSMVDLPVVFSFCLYLFLFYLHPPYEPQLRRNRSWIGILIHISLLPFLL